MQSKPEKKNHESGSHSRGIEPERLVAEIRKRAQEIYHERGEAHGSSLEDWLKAEREIKAKYGIVS
jgi:hypothetical protein